MGRPPGRLGTFPTITMLRSSTSNSSRLCLMLSLGLALLAIGLLLAACGSGDPPPAVAHVGATPITQARLNHWMGVLVAEDFSQHTGQIAPAPGRCG